MGKKSDKKLDKKKKEKLNKAEKKIKKAKKARISPEQRLDMITTAAYYIAEHHGFTSGRSDEDWQEAERQIDEMLKNRS
ncbi:MAG: DUF2934 domain-containing protein [Candidatus Thiodiazotropha sp. (ex Myrtea sp. 'scaly one' KF741663)]|nr:DUF2934 domain-containing protein [Candidatus Thiodiazotropha sp. (ex Myrtea sp. 'scaly one' KF741663)]